MKVIKNAAILMMILGGFMFILSGCGADDHEHDQVQEPQAQVVDDGELAQKTCPVMGLAIDRDIYVDHEGTRVYFCCADCLAQFEENPEKYMEIYHEQLGKGPDEVGDAGHDQDPEHQHHH